MLSKIIEFSVKNKLIIGLFIIALIGLGIYQTSKLPIDAVPDITNNQVQVITIAPSYGASDIERLITFQVEQANSNIEGLKEVRSFSRFGLSLVTIVFEDNIDIYWARQQVAERLQKIQNQIPKGIGNPEMGPITTGLGEIYQYTIRATKGYENQYDAIKLRSIQDWIIRRQLLGVKGVAEVSSLGGKLKQYEIAIRPDKLAAHNISISELFTAIEQNNQNTGGAYIEKGPTVLYIRSEGLIGSIQDIENIAVKWTDNGTPIFVKDIATVRIGYATRYGALCYNDEGEVTGGLVMMLKGANSSEVIKNVKNRIAAIQKTLPKGVVIEPFLERTKMVNSAISTVEKNLIEGALIVVFILVLFLGNFRAGMLVASVIPLSMLFAIIMMNLFGVSGNLMSLGALDFGLIVDGAVIIVEAVLHNLVHFKKSNPNKILNQSDLDTEVKQSASKMMNSAVFGQIIILIVYLPIFTLQGIEGKMFKPMAQTVAFALLGAFILSLTYIPMMSALILQSKKAYKENFADKLMSKIEFRYHILLRKILSIPKTILTIVVSLFILAMIVVPYLGGEFIPALEEGDFAVETRVLTGSNLNTSKNATQKAARVLLDQFPEVEKVVSKIGSGEIPTDPMPIEAADLIVSLKDKGEWKSAKTFNELSDKMSEALKVIPGVTFGFQYPVQMRFNELMTGARQDVVCKIFGDNLDSLAHYAQQLGKIINGVKGCQDLYIEPVEGMPQIIISYNRDAIAQYHLNIEDVNKIINTAFAGQSTGLVFEGEKRFDLMLRLEDEHRRNIDDVRNLLVNTPHGTQIPLYLLASIEEKEGPNQIQREDAQRRIVVGFNVKGRDVQSIVNELKEKTDKKITMASGYHIKYGGSFENLNEAKNRLAIAVPISLLLIFLLLYFAFKSLKQGLLIYTAIPLSAIGGILLLAIRDIPFSISAGVGFIALFGVAVLNGIVLIAEFNRLKSEGMQDCTEIVLKGTQLRLRPVLMTALVASLGFLPMALSHGIGAEVQRPLATVVIGGLMSATFLTLFVLPILYILFEKKSIKINPAGTIILILLLLGSSINGNAQQIISLKDAIDSALLNNYDQKSNQLKVQYQKQLMRSAVTINNTNIAGEYGQMNSIYKDNGFNISQSFSFPTVYNNQHNILKQEWQSAILNNQLQKAALIENLSNLYYRLVYLKEKERLLQRSDSLYSEFALKAHLRFKSGESNSLEKATAEIQKHQIKVQYNALKQEQYELLLRFNLMTNTQQSYQPAEDSIGKPAKSNPELYDLTQHPILKIANQNQENSKAQIKLAQSKLLPEFSVGYNSMTMLGTGADNVTYNRNNRFNAGQIGLSVPLLGGAQQAKIKAAKWQQKISQNQYEQTEKELSQQWKNALKTYETQWLIIEDAEKNLLPELSQIENAANLQLQNGDINYLDWVNLINQSTQAYSNYLDALLALRQSALRIQFFNTKN